MVPLPVGRVDLSLSLCLSLSSFWVHSRPANPRLYKGENWTNQFYRLRNNGAPLSVKRDLDWPMSTIQGVSRPKATGRPVVRLVFMNENATMSSRCLRPVSPLFSVPIVHKPRPEYCVVRYACTVESFRPIRFEISKRSARFVQEEEKEEEEEEGGSGGWTIERGKRGARDEDSMERRIGGEDRESGGRRDARRKEREG